MEVYENAKATPDREERIRVFREVLEIAAENIWTINITTPTPTLVVVKDGKAERRNVKTGGRQPGWVQITDGIEPGDEVISSGTSKVRAGGAVKVVSGSKPGDASASASGAVVKPAGATQ